MKEAVIAGYLRTAWSRSRPGDPSRDWFGNLGTHDLFSRLLPETISRTKISSEEIDDFIVGSALGVSENYTMGGRNPIFAANLSEKIAAKFVDQQCGSSMAALHIGSMEIQTGNADIVLIGGMEHLTRVPMGMAAVQKGAVAPYMPFFLEKKYRHWEMGTVTNMGLTAEKLASQTGFTRKEMDEWGVRSHNLAQKAQEDGFFNDEILTVDSFQKGGTVLSVNRDQAVREEITVEDMTSLKPAYKPDGIITAGNASPLNAGVSSMILMSKETAKKKGIKPLATVRSIGFAGVDPTIMGIGPVPASRKALKTAGLNVSDVNFWEINEAFSIVVLYTMKELGIDPERINVMGGSLAIGHPLGATGIRLVGTLARILAKKEGRYGIATACCGGGQGVATVIERETYNW